MNYFMEDVNDLEEEQLNFNISGPSKSSRKSKTGNVSNTSNIELGKSLLHLKVNSKDSIDKFEKRKNKSNGTHHKTKTSRHANIKQILLNRLKMYNFAEDNARKIGKTRRARQLNRDVQILNALIAHHDSGNLIDLDNIPPEIKIIKPTNAPLGVTFKESAEIALIPDFESATSSATDSEADMVKILGMLKLRRDQYKISVVQNKSGGNVARVLEHLNIVKMFDSLIRHLEMGEKVELNGLPGPPECPICHINSENKKEIENLFVKASISDTSVEEQVMSHSTILHALQKRLQAYEILKMNAKKENNVGETLRLVRIIKIYIEAIRLHRAQKPFTIDDLPSPPGFPPILNLKANTKNYKTPRF